MFLLILGNLGCSVDALLFLDKACSGKTSCEFVVGSMEFVKTHPKACGEVWPYLEVDYQCIEGMFNVKIIFYLNRIDCR